MKNNFGNRLKSLRLAKNLNQEELGNLVGTTKQSISNYETGKRKADYIMLETLADVFNVDIDYLLGKTDKTTLLPQSMKNARELTKSEKAILEPYNKLNEEGKEKVVDYTHDLLDSEKYIATQTVEYIGKAAAGNGYNYLDTITVSTTITAKNRPKYDFIIKVEGDSMEPKILNGALAFVKVDTYFDNGRIYVVDDNGTVYIKKVYFENDKIVLKSINKKYEDIKISFLDGFRILGEVVDWE